MIEESSTAGMPHDVGDLGELALAANLPEKFSDAAMMAHSRGCSLAKVAEEVLGASHAELDACMLAIWGLPVSIVEAVALHHHPAQLFSKSFCPLTAVHAANAIGHAESSLSVDSDYLAELDDRLPLWWETCK